MKRLYPVLLVAGALLIQDLTVSVDAKKFTVSSRQTTLMAKIDRAQRTNELTLKEANDLRDKICDIQLKEDAMKEVNGGKLSYANITELEKDLNKVSNKLHKKQLSKRID